MKDLLIVGAAPSRIMDEHDPPLWGTTALTMLAKYAGVSPRERLYDLCTFENVIGYWPGPQLGNEKYDAWPPMAAKIGGERIRGLVDRHKPSRVITLGVNAAIATFWYKKHPPWFQWEDSYDAYKAASGYEASPPTHKCLLAASPHPGGTSMFWNDTVNRARGIAFWSKVFAQEDKSKRTELGLPEGSGKRLDWGAL